MVAFFDILWYNVARRVWVGYQLVLLKKVGDFMHGEGTDLEQLRIMADEAYEREQEAYSRYAEARDITRAARGEYDIARAEVDSAWALMNREYQLMTNRNIERDRVWRKYNSVKDNLRLQIDALKEERDEIYDEKQKYYRRMKSEYRYGSKRVAPVYGYKRRKLDRELIRIEREIHELHCQIRKARKAAEAEAPDSDSALFYLAKAAFESAKANRNLQETNYSGLSAEKNRLWDEFSEARLAYHKIRREYYELVNSKDV